MPAVWPFDATIVTEIEALETLAGGLAMQSAAGGLAGAEGGVRLVVQGTKEQIDKVAELADSVRGEPPFVETP